MKAIRILLVDDHNLVRSGLRKLIDSFKFPSVIREAAHGLEALEIMRWTEMDIVLLDIQMPVLNGIETVRRLKEFKKRPKVIIMTQFDEQALILHMLQMGVNGFVLKNSAVKELEKAISAVMANGFYCDPIVLRIISKTIPKQPSVINLELSDRENQLMALIIEGARRTWPRYCN